MIVRYPLQLEHTTESLILVENALKIRKKLQKAFAKASAGIRQFDQVKHITGFVSSQRIRKQGE